MMMLVLWQQQNEEDVVRTCKESPMMRRTKKRRKKKTPFRGQIFLEMMIERGCSFIRRKVRKNRWLVAKADELGALCKRFVSLDA
jgi:hypothetical protein